MNDFQSPSDLTFNRGMIADPEAFAREANAASWLYLCGIEFASMDGGSPEDVLARAEADNAPFIGFEDLKAWVVQGLTELS